MENVTVKKSENATISVVSSKKGLVELLKGVNPAKLLQSFVFLPQNIIPDGKNSVKLNAVVSLVDGVICAQNVKLSNDRKTNAGAEILGVLVTIEHNGETFEVSAKVQSVAQIYRLQAVLEGNSSKTVQVVVSKGRTPRETGNYPLYVELVEDKALVISDAQKAALTTLVGEQVL